MKSTSEQSAPIELTRNRVVSTSDLIKECEEQLAGFKRSRPASETDDYSSEEEKEPQAKRPAPVPAPAPAPSTNGIAVPTLLDFQNLTDRYNKALIDKQLIINTNTCLDAQNMRLYNMQLIVNQRLITLQKDMNELVKFIIDNGFATKSLSAS